MQKVVSCPERDHLLEAFLTSLDVALAFIDYSCRGDGHLTRNSPDSIYSL